MKRHGALLVFKPDVTPERAAEALEKIRDVLQLPEVSIHYEELPGNRIRPVKAPFKMVDKIEEYDDEFGGPVWYIP